MCDSCPLIQLTTDGIEHTSFQSFAGSIHLVIMREFSMLLKIPLSD